MSKNVLNRYVENSNKQLASRPFNFIKLHNKCAYFIEFMNYIFGNIRKRIETGVAWAYYSYFKDKRLLISNENDVFMNTYEFQYDNIVSELMSNLQNHDPRDL